MKRTRGPRERRAGGVVDDAALIRGAEEKRIAAAGPRRLRGEPKFNPGLSRARQRRAGAAHRQRHAATTAMALLAAKNLTAALSGRRPPNLLNRGLGKRRR